MHDRWPERRFISWCYNVVGVQALIEEALFLLMLGYKVCRCKINDRRGPLFVDVTVLSLYKHWLKMRCICYVIMLSVQNQKQERRFIC